MIENNIYINKDNIALRNALWLSYGKKCYYCGAILYLNTLTVDHIIPTNYEKKLNKRNREEFNKYLKKIKDRGFKLDSAKNYVPCCLSCNRKKSNDVFEVSNLIFIHEYVDKKLPLVKKEMDKITYKISEDDSKCKDIKYNYSLKRDLVKEPEIINTSDGSFYINGTGMVELQSFLKTDFNTETHCLIRFSNINVSSCFFTLDEDAIVEILFRNIEFGLSDKRRFILYIRDDEVCIEFPNNRFYIDLPSAKDLIFLIEQLYIEYQNRNHELLNTVDGDMFEMSSPGTFKLIRLPKKIWFEMFEFSQSHDYMISGGRWNIFSPINCPNKDSIVLYKNKSKPVGADVLARLNAKPVDNIYFEIYWKQGFTHSLAPMEGFDNIRKWSVKFTHDWLMKEFIPYIISKSNIFPNFFTNNQQKILIKNKVTSLMNVNLLN